MTLIEPISRFIVLTITAAILAFPLAGCSTPKAEKQTKWTRTVKPRWARVHGSYVACPRCASEKIFRTGETQKGATVYRCGECNMKFREAAKGDFANRAINPIQCPKCGSAEVTERRNIFHCRCGHAWIKPTTDQ